MGTLTARLGIEKPVLTDQFSTAVIAANWQVIDDGTAIFEQDDASAIPAVGTLGRFFAATDTGEMHYDDGARWLRVPAAPPGGQHLFEKGSAATPGLGFAGDPNTGIASLGADTLNFVTAGRWHWRLNSQGEFGGRNFSSATASALATQMVGRAHPHWRSRVDGYMEWGTGNAAPDVSLSRDAAQRLAISGGLNVVGDLRVGGNIVDGPTGERVFSFDGTNVTIGDQQTRAYMPDGNTSGVPGVAFQGDTNTGLYHHSDGAIGWYGNGTFGGLLHYRGIRTSDNGSASRPEYSWQNDVDTGFFRISGGVIGFSSDGQEAMRFAGSYAQFKGDYIRVPDGQGNSPGIRFSDPDVGWSHSPSLNSVRLDNDNRRMYLFGRDGAYIDNAFNTTTGSGANVNVTSDGGGPGRLRRVTSLRRHKADITPFTDEMIAKGRALEPVSFRSLLDGDGDGFHVGLIAEDTFEAMSELAVFEEDELQSVAYDRAGVVALALAQRALDRLDAMES